VANGRRGRSHSPGAAQSFAEWINATQSYGSGGGGSGFSYLDHSHYTEGEVLLFAAGSKKSPRHRAAGNRFTVVSPPSTTASGGSGDRGGEPATSRFSDSMTFKEWLRRAYSDEKGESVGEEG